MPNYNATIATFLTFSCLLATEIIGTAYSFPFVRKTVEDAHHDWIDLVGSKEIREGEISSDIVTVTYVSDGKILNATLWTNGPFEEQPNNNLNKSSYGMMLDVDLDGQIDYRMEVQKWNYKENWKRVLREFEPNYNNSQLNQSRKYILNEDTYTSFSKEGQRYVDLSLDLDIVGSPSKYQVLFFTEHIRNNVSLYDYTTWIPIPPPEIKISIVPNPVELRISNPVELRPEDEKTINVQVNSTTPFDSIVYPFVANNTPLKLIFKSNEMLIPPFGVSTIPLKIKVSDNADIQRYPLPIGVNSTILSTSVYKKQNASENTDVSTASDLKSGNLTSEAVLFVDIQKPFGFLEYLDEVNKLVISPLSGIWTFMIGILAVGVPWVLSRYKKIKSTKISRNRFFEYL